MDEFDIDLTVVAFLDPFFNIWSYLSKKDLISYCSCRRDLAEVEVMGFVANELFSNYQLPLIFDNEASYSVRHFLEQLKKYGTPESPEPRPTSSENEAPNNTVADFSIEKRLESASYDEYDDFTPRHPMPRDKVHRRGDSYFNSDIGDAANVALDSAEVINMRKLASLALEVEEELMGSAPGISSEIHQTRSVFS
jgi:hypothetical protein